LVRSDIHTKPTSVSAAIVISTITQPLAVMALRDDEMLGFVFDDPYASVQSSGYLKRRRVVLAIAHT
jgi:hypothetical protein